MTEEAEKLLDEATDNGYAAMDCMYRNRYCPAPPNFAAFDALEQRRTKDVVQDAAAKALSGANPEIVYETLRKELRTVLKKYKFPGFNRDLAKRDHPRISDSLVTRQVRYLEDIRDRFALRACNKACWLLALELDVGKHGIDSVKLSEACRGMLVSGSSERSWLENRTYIEKCIQRLSDMPRHVVSERKPSPSSPPLPTAPPLPDSAGQTAKDEVADETKAPLPGTSITEKQAWPWKNEEAKPLKAVVKQLVPLLGKAPRTIRDWARQQDWFGHAKRPDDREKAVERERVLKTLRGKNFIR